MVSHGTSSKSLCRRSIFLFYCLVQIRDWEYHIRSFIYSNLLIFFSVASERNKYLIIYIYIYFFLYSKKLYDRSKLLRFFLAVYVYQNRLLFHILFLFVYVVSCIYCNVLLCMVVVVSVVDDLELSGRYNCNASRWDADDHSITEEGQRATIILALTWVISWTGKHVLPLGFVLRFMHRWVKDVTSLGCVCMCHTVRPAVSGRL